MKKTSLTVKFVKEGEDEFTKLSQDFCDALGGYYNGAYVEMISVTDIGQQIDDIQAVIDCEESPALAIEKIQKILSSF